MFFYVEPDYVVNYVLNYLPMEDINNVTYTYSALLFIALNYFTKWDDDFTNPVLMHRMNANLMSSDAIFHPFRCKKLIKTMFTASMPMLTLLIVDGVLCFVSHLLHQVDNDLETYKKQQDMHHLTHLMAW